MAHGQSDVLAHILKAGCRGGSEGDLDIHALMARLITQPRACERKSEAAIEMANTPKKMKDPTEAALSAIQDALHVGEHDQPAAAHAPSQIASSAMPTARLD